MPSVAQARSMAALARVRFAGESYAPPLALWQPRCIPPPRRRRPQAEAEQERGRQARSLTATARVRSTGPRVLSLFADAAMPTCKARPRCPGVALAGYGEEDRGKWVWHQAWDARSGPPSADVFGLATDRAPCAGGGAQRHQFHLGYRFALELLACPSGSWFFVCFLTMIFLYVPSVVGVSLTFLFFLFITVFAIVHVSTFLFLFLYPLCFPFAISLFFNYFGSSHFGHKAIVLYYFPMSCNFFFQFFLPFISLILFIHFLLLYISTICLWCLIFSYFFFFCYSFIIIFYFILIFLLISFYLFRDKSTSFLFLYISIGVFVIFLFACLFVFCEYLFILVEYLFLIFFS